jgi:hypothetical protein
MEGPLSQVLRFTHPTEMLVAVAVGVGFGFALERAGFGRADNLVSTFYGRDFRVVRVMFTAIVTAMLGIYFLDLAGILPLSSIGVLDTYLAAQIVGGVLIGVGFIVGGYCPGTSIVAAVSGKVDAILFIGGIVGGSAVYTLAAETMAPLASAGAKGRVLLHEWMGVSSGLVVLGVALFAVGSFWLVRRIETAVSRAAATAARPDAGEAGAHPQSPGALAGGSLS